MNKLKELISVQALSSLQRPCFSPGLLLEDEDLTAGVDYTRDLMRLMVRSLFGCGVVCGLTVTASLTCQRRKLAVSVDAGLALDCMGNPIQVSKGQVLTYDPDCERLPPHVYVVLCYIEKCCRPKDTSCSADDAGSVIMTRARSGFEIKLYDAPPECACSCEPPPKTPTEQRDLCCAEAAGTPAGAAEDPNAAQHKRPDLPTGHAHCECYADHNKGVCTCECGCNCVVIARIDTQRLRRPDDVPEPQVEVYEGMRRFVRPVLTGYLPCIEHRIRKVGAGPNEPIGPRDAQGGEQGGPQVIVPA